MALPREVIALLRTQHAHASRPQLLDLGYPESTVDGWVQRGLLEVAACGTYRAPGTARTPAADAVAAALRCRPVARVTGPLVLGLLGVEGFHGDRRFAVLVPEGRRVSNVPFPVRRDPAADQDRANVDGVPAVTPTRAVVDSGWWLDEREHLAAFDAVRWAGMTDIRRLLRCLDGFGQQPNARRLRRALRGGALVLESTGERDLRDALVGFEPQPEWQVAVTPTRRVDGYWRDVFLALEYAGRRHHSGPSSRAADAARDAELADVGIRCLHLTKGDLSDRAALHARLREARRRRARELGLIVRG